ncbi:hypothetical protein FKW77_008709 [Venturia effusa]|uniref:AB hydrolase-1 domain-containing protein n=1 Tax=Venturia effusa TaxID=50376 RepID=A0A517LBG9_9PEZI|nr:hypothetical protein FKW77_008709 [Venturia effusa]
MANISHRKRPSLSERSPPPEPTVTMVQTNHAKIAVTSIGPHDTAIHPDVFLHPVILCIHGNSFDSTIFKHILASPLQKTHKIMAIDLPGHGKSEDAIDPSKTYNHPGYADCVVELLLIMGIMEVIILGWDLGGHVGIEMLPRFPFIRAMMLVSTPPLGRGKDEIEMAFHWGNGWEKALCARGDLDPDECVTLAETAIEKVPKWGNTVSEFWKCVKRTDQRARKMMYEHLAAGKCSDQKKIVRETGVPIAIVNGAKDHYVNLKFFEGVEFGNLWHNTCFQIPESIRAPFYGDPKAFEPGFKIFVEEHSGSSLGSAAKVMALKLRAKAGEKEPEDKGERIGGRDGSKTGSKNGSDDTRMNVEATKTGEGKPEGGKGYSTAEEGTSKEELEGPKAGEEEIKAEERPREALAAKSKPTWASVVAGAVGKSSTSVSEFAISPTKEGLTPIDTNVGQQHVKGA